MPREYVCTVILDDGLVSEDMTAEEDLNWINRGHLSMDELITCAENEEGCSVTYTVKDL